MIAVPPPPESGLTPGKYVPQMPRLELLFDRAVRARWLGIMFSKSDVATVLGLSNNPSADESANILLWQFIRPGKKQSESRSELFLLAIANANDGRLAIAQVIVGTNDAASGSVVEPFTIGTDSIRDFLHHFLLEATTRQNQLFSDRA